MTTPLRFNLTRKPEATILILLFLTLGCLAAASQGPPSRAAASQNACGATFAGSWQTQRSTDDLWTITVKGGTAEGLYVPVGMLRRMLRGTISGNLFQGEWNEIQGKQGGTFVANLVPPEHRIQVTFYSKGTQVDTMAWFCELPVGSVGTSSPTPTPPPTAKSIRDDQDLDDFKTFDSLAPAEQVIVLTKRGPRFPVEYDASDLSMRVLIKGGWPVVVDYGLQADGFATLSIGVDGFKLIGRKLRPEERSQIKIMLPDEFGTDFRVAKLHIKAVTNDGRPAEFHLFGFAMGQKGVQALRRVNQPESTVQLAMNSAPEWIESDYEPLALFDPVPQAGTMLQIQVSLPATLRAKQHPENHIEFGYVSREDFSEGRWEWWRVVGLHWKKVWQHGTDGPISSNQPKSMQWNGIITSMKLVSTGAHGLHLAAWQKSSGERDWVVARTQSLLTVIE
ncbi:MAG TPA: hypothetical protein VKC61_15410 [Pyrinomonadaceae bacterium]|nr:hypothetical protein [Pyrinomonadaceae bacterium]